MDMSLKPYFGSKVKYSDTQTSPRELCRKLLAHEKYPNFLYPGYIFTKSILDDINIPAEITNTVFVDIKRDEFIEALINYTTVNRTSYRKLSMDSIKHDKLLIELLPFISVDGAWLQGATSLAIAETELGVSLQKQYKDRFERKYQSSEVKINSSFESILFYLDFPQYKPDSKSFFIDENISDHAFEYALLGISLGLFPQTFMPEILGYNLWQSIIGPCPVMKYTTDHFESLVNPLATSYFSCKNSSFKNSALESIYLLLSRITKNRRNVLYRVIRGFFAANIQYQHWEKSISPYLFDNSYTQFLLDILESKKEYITGYHKKIFIDGINLNSYFFEDKVTLFDLLNNIQKSPYVIPGDSKNSRLLSHSTAFGGSMFGVFTAKELQIISLWIDSLKSNSPPPHKKTELKGKYVKPHDYESFALTSKSEYSECKSAELCYYFTNIDLFPIARPFSLEKANQLAQEQQVSLKQKSPPPYSMYTISKLVSDFRIEQANDYKNNTNNTGGIDGIIKHFSKFYGSFLMDGCWLQGSANVTQLYNEEVKILFDIYIDENGDGIWKQNHNNIARDLLQSMDINKPPITSKDYFNLERDSEFSLILPHLSWTLNLYNFIPEILGLNLFIEADGVGAVFRTSATSLKKAGFDPLYFNLHDSIDNFSTGHTAMSTRAIVAYFEKVYKVCPSATETLWERTWRTFQYYKQPINETNDQEKKTT